MTMYPWYFKPSYIT